MGVQDGGYEDLSREVFVQGGCCMFSGRVVVGVQGEGFEALCCKVFVQGGCCMFSGRVVNREQEGRVRGFIS